MNEQDEAESELLAAQLKANGKKKQQLEAERMKANKSLVGAYWLKKKP